MKRPEIPWFIVLSLCFAGAHEAIAKKAASGKKPAQKAKSEATVSGAALKKADTLMHPAPIRLHEPPKPPEPLKPSEPAIEISKLGFLFGMGMLSGDFSYKTGFYHQLSPKTGLEGTFRHVIGDVADHYFISSNLSLFLSKRSAERGKYAPYAIAGAEIINSVPSRGIGGDRVSNMAAFYGLKFRKSYANDLSLVLGAVMHSVASFDHEFVHIPELSLEMMAGGF